jgi:type 1 glutamine amidotransferase/sugar phosphate isomerase/epimerase
MVGVSAGAYRQLTFWDAAAKVDALGLAMIQGVSNQKVSLAIPKNLDERLAPGELQAIRERLRLLNLRMPAYFATRIGTGEAHVRKLFEFAAGLGIETIVCSPDPALLATLDRLANEHNVNVALYNRSREETPGYWNPTTLLQTLEGRGKRIGAAVDTGYWIQEGIKPIEGLLALKHRVLALNLRDRSAQGESGRDVTLGSGVAGLHEIFREMYRMGIKPSFLSVDAGSGVSDPQGELSRSLDAFDKAVHPVMTERIAGIARSAAIRGPDRLSPDERQKIEAALPQRAPATPKKPRKLLVTDLNIAYGGHRSIPHANYAVELMGKRTSAYEAIFSNDLDNLKYPRIQQFDAVYLNNTVGMVFVDPEVREGLTRFVREGGGLAGNHGVSHASMDWAEFGEMIGVKWGVHREPTEVATVRIEDPTHALTAAFGGKEFVYQDEFFRFPIGPYSRDKLRVLLTIDVEKTDMNQGRPCNKPCVRADQDYAVSWIRSYGKGRVFFCILGHNPTLYMTPHLAEYFLAGIQFILGDLEADTTPSAKLRA